MREISDGYAVIVIGSGFGGTIIAEKLARAFNERRSQEKVCILERGQWFISHDYPALPMKRYLEQTGRVLQRGFDYWPKPDNLHGLPDLVGKVRTENNPYGLYNIRMFKDVTVLNSSGVGGGSLIYANVTIRPPDEVIDAWPVKFDRGVGNSEALNADFDEARSFIGVNKIYTKKSGITRKPDGGEMLDRTRLFMESIGSSRLGDWEAVDLSIDELDKDYFSKREEERRKIENFCERQGRCVLGCIPGARHTLNKKIYAYNRDLKDGEPIVVMELCEVVNIKPRSGGKDGYDIEYKNHKQGGKASSVFAKRVVLAAGTLGSTEILLRSRQNDPKAWAGLSDRLGKKFSTNGDCFGFLKPTKYPVNIGRGPIAASHVKFHKNGRFRYTIEDSGMPKLVGTVIAGLVDTFQGAKLKVGGWNLWRRIRTWLGRVDYLQEFKSQAIQAFISQPIVKNLVHFLSLLGLSLQKPESIKGEDELLADIFFFACMGLDRANGQILLKDGQLSIEWPDSDENIKKDPIFKEIEEGMRSLAQHMLPPGKTLDESFIPSTDLFEGIVTIHPLGGCPMGDTPDEGVVESYGRLYDKTKVDSPPEERFYPNLYIVDGSIVPMALGVNPSLTISALAIRAARHIVRSLG